MLLQESTMILQEGTMVLHEGTTMLQTGEMILQMRKKTLARMNLGIYTSRMYPSLWRASSYSTCVRRRVVTILTLFGPKSQRRQGPRWGYEGGGLGEGTLFVTRWIEGRKADSFCQLHHQRGTTPLAVLLWWRLKKSSVLVFSSNKTKRNENDVVLIGI